MACQGRATPSSHGLVRLIVWPLAIVEALLQTVLLPFALLGRACGLPWTVEARYGRRRYHEDQVRGWAASRDRVRRLAEDIEQGGGSHPTPGVAETPDHLARLDRWSDASPSWTCTPWSTWVDDRPRPPGASPSP